jgi:hypothetical protein
VHSYTSPLLCFVVVALRLRDSSKDSATFSGWFAIIVRIEMDLEPCARSSLRLPYDERAACGFSRTDEFIGVARKPVAR